MNGSSMKLRRAVIALLGAALAAACQAESTGPGGGGGVSIYPNPPGPAWSGTAASVTVGERANCLLQADGTVWCWGNTRGLGLQVDIGLRGVPQWENASGVIDSICFAHRSSLDSIPGWPCNVFHPVRMSTQAFASVRLSPQDAPPCGLNAAGTAYCWSAGPHFDVPADSITNAGLVSWCGSTLCQYSPQRVHGAQPLRQYLGDLQAPCAVTVSGVVLCSGSNRYNLLGNQSTNLSTDTLVPVLGAPASTAIAVAPGGAFACALATTGKAWCWGENPYGQVGINVFGGQIASPTQVTSNQNFTAIAAGLNTACALNSAGAAYCWGDGRAGQLGWNSTGWSLVPYPVNGSHTFTAITAGTGHFCGLAAGGAVWCWGDNYLGQLGVAVVPGATCGGQLCSAVPVQVQGGHTFQQISAGVGMTCGVTTASEVYCWGWNIYGRLGPAAVAEYDTPHPAPIKITP